MLRLLLMVRTPCSCASGVWGVCSVCEWLCWGSKQEAGETSESWLLRWDLGVGTRQEGRVPNIMVRCANWPLDAPKVF